MVADLFAGYIYSRPIIACWNMLVRLFIFLIIVLIFSKLQIALKNEQKLSRIDPIIGVYNARFLDKHAQIEIHRSRRYNHPLTVVYLDLDNFKWVNDNLGHQTWRYSLKLLAQIIKIISVT